VLLRKVAQSIFTTLAGGRSTKLVHSIVLAMSTIVAPIVVMICSHAAMGEIGAETCSFALAVEKIAWHDD